MHHKINPHKTHQTPIIPLKANLVSKKNNHKIALYMKNMICLVESEHILFLKADGNYTHVFMNNGEKHTCSVHLKKFADKLGSKFLRVHQSFIVQEKYISTFKTSENMIELKSGHRIPVSRKNKMMINNYFKQWML